MEMGLLELIKTLLEIAALVFLPVVAWLLKTVVSHNRKLDLLEQKVNAEINRRLEVMERKIDTFDNKIESKIDKLEHNINAKIDLMTSILTKHLTDEK
jgi:hypothetical protein